MLKRAALTAAAVAITVACTSAVGGALAGTATRAPTVHKFDLIASHPFNVDNPPQDFSGGDMFGASGRIVSRGSKIGTFASNCVAVPPQGRCSATLLLKGQGRIEVSGMFKFAEQTSNNILAIVGGTRDFRNVGGTASLTPDNKGQVQHVELKIVD